MGGHAFDSHPKTAYISRTMLRWQTLLITVLALLIGGHVVFGSSFIADTVSIESVLDTIVGERLESSTDGEEISYGEDGVINVLLLGLDGRNGETSPHCDAIHLISADTNDWTINISTIPRGTYVYIPGVQDPEELYIANACSYQGIDFAVAEIEKLLNVRTDYRMTVGFSQAMGIFRVFDLPATETLQWLRNRQSYQIGDPQRAHNQAVFIRDMIISKLDAIGSTAMLPVQYAIYQFVDTDMDFAVARSLLNEYAKSGITKRPDDISLQMIPHFDVADYHFDPNSAESQIAAIQEFIEPLLTGESYLGISAEEAQQALTESIENILALDYFDEHSFSKQLWRQVEDEYIRENYHYQYIQKFIEAGEGSVADQIEVISDYILEKQTLGLDDWEEKGRGLLSEVLPQ